MRPRFLQEIARRSVHFLLCALLTLSVAAEDLKPAAVLSYSELTELYEGEALSPELEGRLARLLSVPFVSNGASSAVPDLSRSPELGEFIRVALWNVERGLEYEALEAAFAGEERLAALLDEKRFPHGSPARREILDQAAALRIADVIVLNESDWGMKRSGYRNIAGDLAARLGMNYAFGVEFVELTPVNTSNATASTGTAPPDIAEMVRLDPERYKGLHGTAILSRFPLENVRLVPFKNQAYDWFAAEKKGVSFVEKARRRVVKQVFLEDALREVRRGGRTMLMADISDPRFPAGRATIVATHLESRTSPAKRQVQLREMLETIKPIKNPVILAGDMNTSTTDSTPTTVKRELSKRFGKPQYWIKTGINQLLGFGIFEDLVAATLTFGRNHGDPTVRHIPILMPNEERKFFSILKEFRFDDGGAFDFRGEPSRSFGGKRNTLANSNERSKKGFVTTFRLERPVKFLGKFKLDWIFVKPVNLRDPSDYRAPYIFAPHFGRTLEAVNTIIENRISDHSPMIVDLPLAEPTRAN
jgi:endonuclease/exonuclease/phosphatase family metal-dependent hydrolase